MRIRQNLIASNSLNHNKRTENSMAKNLEKLASGYRINHAADDAAGLSVSESMRRQITELERCQQNVEEGLNLASTAESAMQEINDMLCRAHELCVQSANGTYNPQDLDAISSEMNALFDEIDRITAATHYNEIPLLRYRSESVWGGVLSINT